MEESNQQSGNESWNTPGSQESTRNESWNTPPPPEYPVENKKLIAGILALLFGSLGIHKFVLGYTKEGIIQIIISICTCGIGGIIGFIEGIIYLVKTDADFYNTYQVGRKPWF